MCSRARRRRVSMSERCVPAIYLLVVLLVVPLPAFVFVSAFLASARLMSAFARSCSALACFSQALFSLPFWSSQRSLATSYAASALASWTLRWLAAVGFVFASSSALATFSLPLASFSQTSLAFAFIVSHLALAALYSASMRSSSAFFTWRVVVFCACAPTEKARAAAMLMSWIFIGASSVSIWNGWWFDRLWPSKQTGDERNQEQHNKYDEQDLGDLGRARGDAGKAEDGGDDCDDEES